jgi:hypothetical protein
MGPSLTGAWIDWEPLFSAFSTLFASLDKTNKTSFGYAPSEDPCDAVGQ